MRVVVLTSDNYLWCLRPFMHQFRRHWSHEQECVIVGFSKPSFPLAPNFSFHSVGAYEDYPVGKWSDALIKFLHEFEDETFALFLEDMWIARDVDTQAIRMLDAYARQFKYVLRIDLTTDRLFAGGPKYPMDIPDYGSCGYLDLIRSEPDSPYHLSMMPAIWRKDQLLKVLIPGESPWDVEIAGTRRASALGNNVLVLGTRQWIVRNILALRGGDSKSVNLSGLTDVDKAELIRLGYDKPS